jgi:hypothetical protein
VRRYNNFIAILNANPALTVAEAIFAADRISSVLSIELFIFHDVDNNIDLMVVTGVLSAILSNSVDLLNFNMDRVKPDAYSGSSLEADSHVVITVFPQYIRILSPPFRFFCATHGAKNN